MGGRIVGFSDCYTAINQLGISDRKKDFVCNEMLKMEMIDPKTYRHSVNLANMMRRYSYDSGLDMDTGFLIGLLHDIGKRKINRDVLLKEGTYTQEEYLEMQKHVRYSYEILKEEFPFIAELALRHHTNQGDRSYPKNLPLIFDSKMRKSASFYLSFLSVLDAYEARHSPDRINDGWEKRADVVASKNDILTGYHDKIFALNNFA